jgi:hypothetical protein
VLAAGQLLRGLELLRGRRLAQDDGVRRPRTVDTVGETRDGTTSKRRKRRNGVSDAGSCDGRTMRSESFV